MNTNLRTAWENFKHCADEAPEGCYEEAKRLNEVIGDTCTSLMREVRSLGLKADDRRRTRVPLQARADDLRSSRCAVALTIIATVTGR